MVGATIEMVKNNIRHYAVRDKTERYDIKLTWDIVSSMCLNCRIKNRAMFLQVQQWPYSTIQTIQIFYPY